MADTFTTNLNLTKPEVGASTDTWGTKVNADLDTLDGLFQAGPALKLAKGGTGATTAAGALANLGLGNFNNTNSMGFRNRIINGDMRIDQRNAGAAITSAGYCVDRWNTDRPAGAVYTQQQVADAPAGFVNSLRITNTTPATPTSGQYTFSRQIIEGLNISDLGWGTASAQAVTVSFWVKASITGTYSLFAINSAEDRSYVGTFAVSAANTWEFKTVTIPGDTSGTWLTNNSNGIRFGFDLGSGSNFQGTGNAWNSGWKQRTSGTVNFCQTSGATFQFTGVQLEAGTVATPFERRDYGRELMMCQRYYQGQSEIISLGVYSGGLGQTEFMRFLVQMRAAPTVAATPAGFTSVGYNSTSSVSSAVSGFRFVFNTSTAVNTIGAGSLIWAASAEL
jgi:hypothetical protein